MIYVLLAIVCLIVCIWAKNKTTNDWMQLCANIYGGSDINYRYLVVTIISLVLTLLFGWLGHSTVINAIHKLFS